MFKNRKKGFSLIELLAVVIILAILALILIPFIGNLIKQAKINSAVVSAYGYVEATNNEVVSKQTKGEKVDETQYEISNYNIVGNLLTVKYEGKGPEKGWFILEREKVKEGEFCINGYEVKYENGKATYNPTGEYCAPPPRPTICRITEAKLNYTETTEFEVAKVEDLVCLSDLVNNGYTFEGKTITLTNDIDFNVDNSYNDPAGILDGHLSQIKTEVTTGAGFMPIGSNTKQFKGTFKSSNFNTISNLYINRSGGDYTGLFGYIGSGSKIKNIKILSSNIIGKNYTGIITGYSNVGNIENVYLSNTSVTGSNNTGGIVGYMVSNSSIQAVDSDNLSVTGNDYTGGIVGYSEGTLREVIFDGTVTGKLYTGGIVGRFLGQKIIDGAYIRNGVITGTSFVGGLYGSTNSSSGILVKGIFESGSITGTSTVGKIATSSVTTGYVSNIVSKTGNGDDNGKEYDITKHYIGMYDDVLDTVIGGIDGEYYFDFENDNLDKIVLKNKTQNPITITLSGSGTSSDPYILRNEKDFKDASYLGKQSLYFKLGSDIDISTFRHFYQLGTTNNYFNGVLDGDNKTISNMIINGGKNSGFIGLMSGGTVKNLKMTNSSINNLYLTAGTGTIAGDAANSRFENIDLSSVTIRGGDNTGGVVGKINNTCNILAINSDNLSVTGNDYTGGIVGYSEGTLREVIFDGTVTGKLYTSGIVGRFLGQKIIDAAYIRNGVITGTMFVGGLYGSTAGYSSSELIRGIFESGSISGTNTVGKIATSSVTTGYVSNIVSKTGTGGTDGTVYPVDEANLEFYGSIKYTKNNIQCPLLDSSYTGDVNNTGYWFAYDANGLIRVVRVGSATPIPNPPVCDGDCTNPSTYPLESNNVTGTCPSGDVTPPTCIFKEFVAVTNGIRASFSCTDDTSVPTVASMFNSTTKEIYTFEQITDQERGGTVKTGIVSGNTRNITSTWTTTTVPSNPPQRGLCYYYQMAAKDECGNEGDYTTSYCYYGFSN